MSRKIKEVNIEEVIEVEGGTIEEVVSKEKWTDKSKKFLKKQLPKVGYVSVGIVIGVGLAKKFPLTDEVIEVIENGVEQLGE